MISIEYEMKLKRVLMCVRIGGGMNLIMNRVGIGLKEVRSDDALGMN